MTTAAPVVVHADVCLTGHYNASPLRHVINHVATLPTVTQVDVWADIAPKTLGVPTGVAITTSAVDGHEPMVYPTAVTDIACGFAVIATGIDPTGWSRTQAERVFTDICAAIGVTSPDRIAPVVDTEAVLTAGLAALPDPVGYNSGHGAEQPDLTGDPSLFDLDMRRLLAEHAGSVTGHFVAFYTAQRLTPMADVNDEELVLVVHTGAPAIRAWAYEHVFAPMARRCLELRLIDPRLVGRHHLFGLPASEALSRTFLRFADTAVLYGYATRHLCAETILDTLARHRPRRIASPRLLRHTGHGWYSHRPSWLRSGRGIQPMIGPEGDARLSLVVGADRTHSYLVLPGPASHTTGGLVGHGIPMWDHQHPPTNQSDPAHLFANTPLDFQLWRNGVTNLALTMASLATTGLALPAVRLLPWANYKELYVDAVTRPRT